MDKAPDAFRTISEVADELDVPQHVLRFWESRFREIKPMKRGGGRRYYRPDDVDLLRGIRHLLYGEGYTIRGVQRILKEQGGKFVQTVWQPGAPQPAGRIAEAGSATDGAAERRPPTEDARSRRPVNIVAPPRPADDKGRVQREAPPERREPSLPSQRIVPPPAASAGGFGQADLRKLKDALNELTECRRVLDAALGETG